MPIVVNGTTIDTLIVNGTTCDDALANGTDVYDTSQAQTDAPTINFVRSNKSSITIDVTNNDGSTAEIKCDIEPTNPPTTVRDSALASGSTTSDIRFSGLSSGTSYTFYATAQASGESVSTVASASFSTS